MKTFLIVAGCLTLLTGVTPRPCVAATGRASIVSSVVEPYPVTASKKGLQVEWVDDAIALGVKHAALNFNLCELVDPVGLRENPAWELAGKTFRFQRGYLARMDQQIKPLSEKGILVHLILLTYASGDASVNRLMLHPNYSTNAPNRLGAFNTATEGGRLWLQACLEFMAERWSRPDRQFGRVVGYILGNEVNSHWFWSNMGRVTMPVFTDAYEHAARIVSHAIRKQCSWGRLYLSLEHHWNIRYPAADAHQAFAGREFLEYFARRSKDLGDFEWHLAFHPYPENLFEPRFWKDSSAIASPSTPRITFKNLNQITDFMGRPELFFEGKPRRIILSEQGFHTPNGDDGETLQAAAYCYAYKIVDSLPGIDAFILHRHVDHPAEGGLWLGLRSLKSNSHEARPRKKIYDCFRLADTPGWEEAFRFALPVIGIKTWEDGLVR